VGGDGGPLACPRCARKHSLEERFCRDCGMPLVHVGRLDEEPITEAQERARKVKPQYTGGELVKVAGGRNQAEAELIQGMLLEEGIPSVQRRTRGFDVPDFLAAGPRDILVPQAAAEDARALLAQAESRVPGANGSAAPGAGDRAGTDPDSGERPLRLLVWILVAFVAAAAIVWVLYQLTT
jgi:Putative prokaryotic signal transducing protein